VFLAAASRRRTSPGKRSRTSIVSTVVLHADFEFEAGDAVRHHDTRRRRSTASVAVSLTITIRF